MTLTKYNGKKRRNLHEAGSPLTPKRFDEALAAGLSVRLLCPQKHHDNCWASLSGLEEYFGAMVGANAYLTPAASQGFAPHYDDIEAFVIQLEGRKRWRVYECPEERRPLPRFSSEDFEKDAVGEPLMDLVLEPGDLLFMPRGFVHQAETVSSVPSLHITLSTAQNNSWADMLDRHAGPTRWVHTLDPCAA